MKKILYAGSFSGDEYVDFHTHHGTELIYIESGVTRIETENSHAVCQPGATIIIPPEMPHNQIHSGITENMFISYTGGIFTDCTQMKVLKSREEFWISRWFREILELFQQNMAEYIPPLLTLLEKRIQFCLAGESISGQPLPSNILAAKCFMDQEFSRIKKISEVAEKIGLSESRLKMAFHKCTGETPGKYLNRVRMMKAELLLRNPRLRVDEIAQDCGYGDDNYFIKKFRAVHGITPGEYRMQFK